MSAVIAASVLWPSALLDEQMLASVLAVLPALLLAHYRRWTGVSILLGLGIVLLSTLHFTRGYFIQSFEGFPYVLMVAPYLAIALGAGWFGEVRRYKAELHAARLQLIQSEKLDSIGRMAAGVAHEVKNPLMTILTGVKILSKRMADADETTRTLLADMTEAVSRADKIIGGLLSYSRERELDVASVDLNATIEASLRLVKHELDKARIEIVTDLDPALPRLQLDQFKLQQVFVNLLTNALHAMGEDGTITLRTSLTKATAGRHVGYRQGDRFAPGEAVAIAQLDDSGPGIPAEILGKIFDPFFTTKPTGIGTGLGLSVCQQIIDMHGGTIEIGNCAEGGARVTMCFKVETKEGCHAKTTHPARR